MMHFLARDRWITFILMMVLLPACNEGNSQANQNQKGEEQSFSIVGSDTEVNVVNQLAEEFMKQDSTRSISVTGGGSGAGLNALIKGSADIANSSRKLSDSEQKRAQQNGMRLVPFVFGKDAVAFVTHPNLPVEALTLKQLGAIYRGEITNWKEVGGYDAPISLYGRQSSSGTFIYIRQKVLQGDYAQTTNRMNGNAQIVESVRRDSTGIGYVGIGYIVDADGSVQEGLQSIKIQLSDSTIADPANRQAISAGQYPLSRPLYQYFDVRKRDLIAPFLRFEISDKGQEIVRNNGFYALDSSYQELNQEALKPQTDA